MVQGKMTSLLLNQENCTTLIHRLQSRFFLKASFLECFYSLQGISALRLSDKKPSPGNNVGKSDTVSKGFPTSETQGASTLSLHCLPRRRIFSGSPQLLQNYLFSILFIQTLSKVILAYLAGRHASFNINSPCDSPFTSNLSSNTWIQRKVWLFAV